MEPISSSTLACYLHNLREYVRYVCRVYKTCTYDGDLIFKYHTGGKCKAQTKDQEESRSDILKEKWQERKIFASFPQNDLSHLNYQLTCCQVDISDNFNDLFEDNWNVYTNLRKQ